MVEIDGNCPAYSGLFDAESSAGAGPVSRSGAAMVVQFAPRFVERDRLLQPRDSVAELDGSWTSGASVVQRRPLPREPKPRLCVPATPFFTTVAPDACANASAGVSVTPVPAAPDVPTVVIVTVSGFAPVESMVIVLPATRPVTLASFTFVAPAAAAAESVVVVDATSWTPLQPAFWLHE